MLNVDIRKNGRDFYNISFLYEKDLVENIKTLPKREYDSNSKTWKLNTINLFELIKKYKGKSNEIFFNFIENGEKEKFIKKYNNELIKQQKEEERISNLLKLKDECNQLRKELMTLETVPLDYEKYLNKGITPYEYQKVAAIFAHKLKKCLFAMDMGTGKAQKLTSKILTPNGWKQMGQMEVGDEIINSQGKISKVTGVYPQGIKEIYKIEFTDNTSTECCGEHLWTVFTANQKHRNHENKTYSVNELLKLGLYYNSNIDRKPNKKFFIPIIKPIEFNKKELPIHPYILGCILGDGGLTVKNNTHFTSSDLEIINSYNSHTKFIPEIYKFSSIEDRIELLKGLMDTDGYCDKNNGLIEYTSVSKDLIEDVKFIIQSLGGIAKSRKIKFDKNGFHSYRISITLPNEIIPFKLKRKLDIYKPKTKYQPYRGIKSITLVGEDECQCISVDASDSLYVTNDCILTHNTLSSLLTCEMYEESVKKVLIICPNSLKFNWGLEILKFCGKPYYILNEKKKSSNVYTVEESKYFIINYEAFNRSNFDPYNKLHSFGLKKIDMLICDESHKLKNSKSNTVTNIRKLFKNKVDRVILASGTIMPNRITDLFIQLNMLDQDAFPSKNRFYNEYCNMVFNIETNSWDEISTPNYEKLHEDLSHIMFRVRKKDVLKDLPDLIVNKVYLEMTSEQEKEYNKIENQFNDISWDEDNGFRDSSPSLVIMNKLRQYTSSIKLDTVKDFIDDLNEEENKVLVFDCFKKPLYELNERFNNSSVYSGDIESSERQELVNKFQKSNNKDLMNLLITMQSGNFGITLTEASKIVVLNQSFVPSENEQCYARAHRIGQKNSVMVYIFIFKNSIDDLIDKAINNKQIGISKVVDGEDFSDTSNSSTLSEVMNIYKKRFKK